MEPVAPALSHRACAQASLQSVVHRGATCTRCAVAVLNSGAFTAHCSSQLVASLRVGRPSALSQVFTCSLSFQGTIARWSSVIMSGPEQAAEANDDLHLRASQALSALGDFLGTIREAVQAKVSLEMTRLATQHPSVVPTPPTTCPSQVSPSAAGKC